jgi:hypothetical protein
VIFQPAVLTQAEIRNNYMKIILGRWKQWQNHLMLICMLQVRLKISNSCWCFCRCRKAIPDFRTSVRECIFHTICFWIRQCPIGSRLSCVMAVYIHHPHLWTYHTSNRGPICFSPCTWELKVVAFFFRGSELLACLIYQPIVSYNSHE